MAAIENNLARSHAYNDAKGRRVRPLRGVSALAAPPPPRSCICPATGRVAGRLLIAVTFPRGWP